MLLATINNALALEHGKPIAPYLGNVGTRAISNTGQDTTNRQIMSVATFFPRDTVTSLKIVVPNFWVNGNGNELGNDGSTGGTATIKASVEYPLGTCTQIKFGGNVQGSIGAKTFLLSDSVVVSIPQGAKAKIRLYWIGSAGAIYNDNESTSLGDAMAIGASGISDQTLSCDTVTDSGSGNYLAPLAILSQTTKPTVCIIGDSIAFGTDASPNSNGDVGTIAQSVGPAYGYINMAVPSTSALEYVSNSTVRQGLYGYCSHLIVQFGAVDFETGQTVAQLKTNLTTIYNAFSVGTVIQSTLVPQTTSTDSWATTANQTVKSWESNRTSFNDQLRATTFGPNGGEFDVDSVLETAIDSGLWRAGTGWPQCSPWTGDGIHPNTCGYAYVQSSGIVNNLSIHYP